MAALNLLLGGEVDVRNLHADEAEWVFASRATS
jgi:hypothetical protein